MEFPIATSAIHASYSGDVTSQLVTDASGNVAAHIIYDAWGNELYASDSVPNGMDARFGGRSGCCGYC